MVSFQDRVAIYKTLPVDTLATSLSPGRTVIIGRAATALARSLPGETIPILWKDDDTADKEPLANIVAAMSRYGPHHLIVTELDLAERVLDEPSILQAIRQELKSTFILPLAATTALRLTNTNDLAPMEEDQGGSRWRWIIGPAASCSLQLHASSWARQVRLTFTPWFSAFAHAARPRGRAKVSLTYGTQKKQARILINRRCELAFELAPGLSRIDISVDLPVGTVEGDPRPVSMALVDPLIVDEDGAVLLSPAEFGGLCVVLPVNAARERLHRAGFYAVGGLACCEGAREPSPIAVSHGSPSHGLHLEREAHTTIEPTAGSGTIYWLTAGDYFLRKSS